MTATATNWRNRIVGNGEESPDQLLANPANWRIHPKHQQDALAGVLNEVGWVQQVIVNQRTGHLVDGHLRVSLALRREEPTIPVVYVDLDEDEEALVLATIDPLAALAVTDAAKLDELLADLTVNDAAVQSMINSLTAGPDVNDPNAEWVGMPEFQQDDQSAAYRCIVNFASEEDMQAFERLVGQPIPRNTKSIWHPKVERQNVRSLGYASDVT